MKKILTLLIVLSMFLMTGCSKDETMNIESKMGTLLLSVNPQIQIDYNDQGICTNVQALNDDAKEIITNYDYANKDTKVVVHDLILKINEAGYFVEDLDGNINDIVIQVKAGSVNPSKDYFDELEDEVIDMLDDLKINTKTTSINTNDYDPKYNQTNKPSNFITIEKAQEIALNDANITDNYLFTEREYELDDNRHIYEIEFIHEDMEYEYEIDATNGIVLSKEVELKDIDDDFDDDDDDDDDFVLNVAISKDQALDIALKAAGLVNPLDIEVELDKENGIVIYEVSFEDNNQEYEYEIDANNGSILKQEIETD